MEILVGILLFILFAHMKNLKKLFASVASLAILASMLPVATLGAASYSDELQEAYDYAYNLGITTMSSIDGANMYGTLTRAHMAKMIVNRAKEVKDLEADTDKTCEFNDIASQSAEMKGYIEEACQMGLMGVGITAFNPNGAVTRAQFGTVLSRVLRGDENEGGDPYYADHLAALEDAGIMNNISNPMANEIRGYVMLMMMRADADAETPEICETPENQTACSLGLDSCPEECMDDEDDNEVKAGNLAVSLEASEGWDVPEGISSLEVATYTFEAGDEDVTLDAVTFEQLWYGDSSTLDGAALFIDGARVSKVSDFNTDDEVTLNLTNSYEVKAGESVEIALHVAVAADAGDDQFSIDLTAVNSSAEDVDMDDDLASETYNVLNKANAKINITSGSVSDELTLGTEGAELFEFDIDNVDTNDQDLLFKSITFKGIADTDADYLENFVLVADGEAIAETDSMNGKYLSFNIEDGYVIDEDESETFTVEADIIGGAGETIQFQIEKAMDVVVLWDKYDVTVNVDETMPFAMADADIEAGDLSLERVNPADDDLIGNRDNLPLWAFIIKNNAGGTINLQDFTLTFTPGAWTTLTGVLETVKVKLWSTSATSIELDENSTNTIWTAEDLEKSFGSSLTVYVYADTVDAEMDGQSIRMKLDNLVIEESSDDEVISDYSPSSLTWSLMQGSDAELTLTQVTLWNKTVSEWTEEVEALSFKVKAGSTYGATLKKMTFTASGSSVDDDTVVAAKLYKGTTEIDADIQAGKIVINDDVELDAGETATFTLKLDLNSNPEVTGFSYYLSGSNIEAEDTSDDTNTISISGRVNGRHLTVTDAGTITLTYESSVDNNEDDKNILAGQTATVAEYSLYSKYETANVTEAELVFSTDIQNSIDDVELYYDGALVASNPTWATATKAVFDNLDFDTFTSEKPLLVKVVSKVIDEDGWATLVSARVTSIDFTEVKWNDSGEDIAVTAETSTSKYFGIVPATIFTSVSNVASTTADLNVLVSRGDNTDTSNVAAKATLTGVVFTVEWNNGALTKVLVKDNGGTVLWSGTITNDGDYTVALTKEASAGTTTLKVSLTQSGSIDNPSYTISVKEVQYYTNVNGAGTALTDRAGETKTIISK